MPQFACSATRLFREAPLSMQLRDVNQQEGIELRRPVILDVRRAVTLVYNPKTDNEGIYSRRSGENGVDMILCFEDQEDAERYTEMLAAQDFPEATPVEMDTRMLLEFCDEGGHTLGLVRRGVLVVPPEANVPMFDWSPGTSSEGELPPQDMSVDELEERRRSFEALLD